MGQRSIGDLPALIDLEHHSAFRHAHICEENLVEIGSARHVDERPNFDTRNIHREKDVGYAMMFFRFRIGSYQTENHVGLSCGRRPYLLAVNDELVAIFDRTCSQRSQIRSCSGFGISLTPDQFSLQRSLYIGCFLLRRTELQQGGNQHGYSLSGQWSWQTGSRKLFSDDA